MDQPFEDGARVRGYAGIEQDFAKSHDRADRRSKLMANVGHELFFDAIRFDQSLACRLGVFARRKRLLVEPAILQREGELVAQSSKQTQILGAVFTARTFHAEGDEAVKFVFKHQRHQELGVELIEDLQPAFAPRAEAGVAYNCTERKPEAVITDMLFRQRLHLKRQIVYLLFQIARCRDEIIPRAL